MDVLMPNARERRLLRLIAEAKTAKEIASLLFKAANTVRGHIADLGRDVGAAQKPPRLPLSQAELMVWVQQNPGVIRPDGLAVVRHHPPNCGCSANYCQTMFVSQPCT